jgi:flagellin-like hook-associated protein FlgL
MIVQHNITAMNANRMLGLTTGSLSKSTEKLSSGYRINRAADDAAGLTISEKMRKQIRGLDQASTNAEDGVSAVQTAEGALTEVHSMLQRMNELAVQASNGTNSEDDRKAIQDEISQLTTEIDRVSETTKFNETYLLKGDGSKSTKTVNAHDAGLAGKLVDNGNGTSTFSADDLKVGDKVTIAGKEYTIGKSADVADYVKKGSINGTKAPAKTGDSVTHNGVTTTIVDKMKTADASANAKWAANDTFVDADGKEWTVIAAGGKTDATKGEVLAADVATYLKDGSVITKNVAFKVGTGDATDIAKKLTVVDALEDTEVSITDATGIKNLATNAVAGDIVTANGTSLEVTEEAPTSMKDVAAAIKAAGKGDTIKIGTKSYTLGVTTDKDNDTYTADDLISMIKEGDTVNAGAADYTVIGVSATTAKDADTITLNEAYNKMAEELQKASSIGTDEGKAATVSNKGNGTFEIKNGSVEVKNGLSFNLHVGADADMTNKINVDIDTMSAAGLGIKDINVADDTGAAATYAIDAIADAVAKVSSQRSALGAVQNRLEHTIDNLDNVVENTTSAESRIRDTDMAEEMVNYSKNSILQQAGQSMLAQANQANQGVLSLLQ